MTGLILALPSAPSGSTQRCSACRAVPEVVPGIHLEEAEQIITASRLSEDEVVDYIWPDGRGLKPQYAYRGALGESAPIQCGKGACSLSFHVTCAQRSGLFLQVCARLVGSRAARFAGDLAATRRCHGTSFTFLPLSSSVPGSFIPKATDLADGTVSFLVYCRLHTPGRKKTKALPPLSVGERVCLEPHRRLPGRRVHGRLSWRCPVSLGKKKKQVLAKWSGTHFYPGTIASVNHHYLCTVRAGKSLCALMAMRPKAR